MYIFNEYDASFMPRPWEMKERFDTITTDFAYVRWLGDRKGIEKQQGWKNWVDLLKEMVNNKKIRKLLRFREQPLRRAWARDRETVHGLVGQETMKSCQACGELLRIPNLELSARQSAFRHD